MYGSSKHRTIPTLMRSNLDETTQNPCNVYSTDAIGYILKSAGKVADFVTLPADFIFSGVNKSLYTFTSS